MLGKLLKYELSAVGRILLPLFGIMIILAVLAALSLTGADIGALNVLMVFLFGGVTCASVVVTLYILIQRYQKNLLSDEGYLMFTLPVSSAKLIWSKLISCLIWMIVGTIVGIFSITLVCFISTDMGLTEILDGFNEFWAAFTVYEDKGDVILLIINSFVNIIINMMFFFLLIFFALSVGQMPKLAKHSKLYAFIVFIVVFWLVSYISTFISPSDLDSFYATGFDYWDFQVSVLIDSIFYLIWFAVLFFATNWILNNKLNLE